jgi:hypothetical protein
MGMKNSLIRHSLREQIIETPIELLDQMIEEFSCVRDKDVESFLKNAAVKYDREGYGRTNTYVDYENDDPVIVAFFTVAITATSFLEVSKSRKRKMLHSKPGRDSHDYFGGILIGQVGRADGFDSDVVNGQEMLSDAEVIIEMGREYIGGKIVYLDCKELLIPLYQSNGYDLLMPEPFSSGYYKMFKILPEIF